MWKEKNKMWKRKKKKKKEEEEKEKNMHTEEGGEENGCLIFLLSIGDKQEIWNLFSVE